MGSLIIAGFCVIAVTLIQCTQAVIEQKDAENIFFLIDHSKKGIQRDDDGYVQWDHPDSNILYDTLKKSNEIRKSGRRYQMKEVIPVLVVSRTFLKQKLRRIMVQEVTDGRDRWYLRVDPFRPYLFYFKFEKIYRNSTIISVLGYMPLSIPMQNSNPPEMDSIMRLLV